VVAGFGSLAERSGVIGLGGGGRWGVKHKGEKIQDFKVGFMKIVMGENFFLY